jgi:hypothetical protein
MQVDVIDYVPQRLWSRDAGEVEFKKCMISAACERSCV